MKLNRLNEGYNATITNVSGSESLRRHMLDMGLIPGTKIGVIKKAPLGDPIEIKIRGYSLTLRLDEAKFIEIGNLKQNIHGGHRRFRFRAEKHVDKNCYCSTCTNQTKHAEEAKPIAKKECRGNYDFHPCVGEEIKYKPCRNGDIIPKGEKLTFALIGNQNSGKTTLFNQLTGSNQHVGNFPGVTVDRKDGYIKNHKEALVTDLPGIYSLSPYSSEELVTRDFLIKQRPNAIINILDANNIERNMYLTTQLIELNIPMVLALNMMDEVTSNGGTIMINKLESRLGMPVVPISASKNEGIEELIEHAIHIARHRERPGRVDFCDPEGSHMQQALHRCIHSLIYMTEDHSKRAGIPSRFAATKLVEDDKLILDALQLDDNEKLIVEKAIKQLEDESNTTRDIALAQMRYNFIDYICEDTIIKPEICKERERSITIDKVLTGKFTAIPSFLLFMALIFTATFAWIGPFLSDWLNIGIESLTSIIDNFFIVNQINDVVRSLVIDGIFAGVGSVLSFLPYIVVLFFFLSMMEDSGYMARIAFIMDKPLRKLGLSGRSFVPMLIGFGCSVPAIMATRTLSSERDRKMTIYLTPFMSCSAKLPIYVLFAAAFFPAYQWLVIVSLYLLGILAGILFALLMNGTKYRGKPIPFVMELPNYRFPNIKSVGRLIWRKAKDFITKAFTIIFIASIVIWFLQKFNIKLNVVSDSSQSLLATVGNFIAPIFQPLGFGDWRVSTALITGFVAKESVVSTLTVLVGDVDKLKDIFTSSTAFVFLIFTLYYTPCVAAISAVKRELSSWRETIKMVIFQCVFAWIASYLFVLLFRLLGIA